MDYRKHAEYWGGDPFIDRWSSPIIPEYSNQYAQFVNGNIISFLPTGRDVLLLARDAPNTVIVSQPIPDDNVERIRFGRNNQKTLPWKDVRVRVALRRAMNMQGIGEFLANKQQFEAQGIPVEVVYRTHLPHNPSYWLDPAKGELGELSANYIYDVAEARKLMQAAGFDQAVPVDYHVLPEAGEVPEEQQLVIDSLNQSGLFAVNTIRSANTVAHRNCRSLGQCDGLVQSGVSEDADHIIYRDYHSQGNTEGEQAYPDPRIDAVAEAQRRELDPARRIEYLKEFQRVAAELMPTIPFIHDYTTFVFRWPWLHNYTHGWTQGEGMPTGRPVLGGHLQWLDPNMPNRNSGAT
jgi:ABC-type transport system substrate-binding protein